MADENLSLATDISYQIDQNLVLQAQEGELVAMRTLFERHHRAIYHYLALMVGHEALAAELTQEVFLKTWDEILNFTSTRNVVDWLYCIATNLVQFYQSNYYAQYLQHLKQLQEQSTSVMATPEMELRTALQQVTFLYRACLLLHEREGLSFVDIAQRFSMTAQQVKRAWERGQSELMQLLPQNFTCEVAMAELRQLSVNDRHIAYPFLDMGKHRRQYVQTFTIKSSSMKPPRLPFFAQLYPATRPVKGRPYAPYTAQKLLSAWVIICIIGCTLSLLITSSTTETAQEKEQRLACSFNSSFIRNDDKSTTICIRQSRQIHGYTFSLEQIHLNTNQLLLASQLEDPHHKNLLFSINAVDIRVMSSYAGAYTCHSTYSNTYDSSHNPIVPTTVLSFAQPFLHNAANNIKPIMLSIRIRQIIFLSIETGQIQMTGGSLLRGNEAPLQFNIVYFAPGASLLPAYPIITPTGQCAPEST